MTLTYLWIVFVVLASIVALIKLIFDGDTLVFNRIVESLFQQSKLAIEISIGIMGLMGLWLGILKVGEKAGLIKKLSCWVSPFLSKLFPEIPKNHPALGSITMNFTANMMGLDNAATPLGLKAMKDLQGINKTPDIASNPMIMFLVLNASSLTLLPITIFAYRHAAGSNHATDVYLPILLATFVSTLVGIISVSFYQKINLFSKENRIVPISIFSFLTVMVSLLVFFPLSQWISYSNVLGNTLIFATIVSISVYAFLKKVNIFTVFIKGAKEGIWVAFKIIPYLIGILALIGIFRASGTLELLSLGMEHTCIFFGIDAEFIKAIPVALVKPLSGSGARGMMIDIMNQWGADSFPSKVAAIIQGSTETTFYVIAVYYGSIAIKNIRHTLSCALLAELAGIIASIILAYLFFK